MSGIEEVTRDPDLEWLDHVRPTGLVLSTTVIKERGLVPERQTQVDTAEVAAFLNPETDEATLLDSWAFFESILGWKAEFVAGSPKGQALPEDLTISIPEHETVLAPDWAVQGFDEDAPWQLLVQLLPAGMDPDRRGEKEGWEATPHQRFERLLRETDTNVGVMVSDNQLRLIFAPKGETSGWLSFPLRALAGVAGRPMLGGLKLLLDASRLFRARSEVRLRALLLESREAQAAVSSRLSEQVLGALHELLRGFNDAEPEMIGRLAREDPKHLYEGLLTTLMRLVFVLYAEDRDLIPSRSDGAARSLYDNGYSVRGLFGRLYEDAALNPDTMEERYGGWGRLLALFRLVHGGHASGFVNARGGKLFDPDAFPFLEGRGAESEPPRVPKLSDGCLLRILEALMTVRDPKTKVRQRLSYRTLDVEQIGSVYETVMGFTVEIAQGQVLAIRAGKNNRTPVFADLDELATLKPKDRQKYLRDECKRTGTLGKTVDKPLQEATAPDAIAAALDPIVDERGSPAKRPVGAGTPVLQPTEERRRTGSHYTPRSLTEPIVRHALEPAFERLGPDATAEEVLDLKVCDPAMGSGAFLVEACRAIAARLVKAWARWPESRPTIPADEDEDLHARRLVAQRCLYGVDRNARAVDLARLSLWLTTLAKDHEFTFLDHALKCGDSLVGLTPEQIAAANWDASKPGLPLLRPLVSERVAEADRARAEIRSAPDDTMRAIQEQRHKHVETRLSPVRLLGDAVIAAFFSADKAKAREKARADAESWFSGRPARWDLLEASANALREGEYGIPPFHWDVEFPEVFVRENGGFDAIMGNPPFLGGRKISSEHGVNYASWLSHASPGSHGNADLVAHFFIHSFGLLRDEGALGLIATKTIGQGETRLSGLTPILTGKAHITHAVRRLRWPGDAMVIVAVIHIQKTEKLASKPLLDGKEVSRISAYLVEGELDTSPKRLVENAGLAFQGSIPLGKGFVFDDIAHQKGLGPSKIDLEHVLSTRPQSKSQIFPYLGGDDINNDPSQTASRLIFDLESMSLNEAKGRYPELVEIAEDYVKPERSKQKREDLRSRWWQFAYRKNKLYKKIRLQTSVLVCSQATKYVCFSRVPSSQIFDQKAIVVAAKEGPMDCVLNTRIHWLWVENFASTLGETLNYSTGACFETFPFPSGRESPKELATKGQVLLSQRLNLMSERGEGLTKTYNRFHDRGQNAPDIVRLRELHAEMDAAVLRAYGWDDLADRAHPEFIEQDADEGKQAKTRLDWPSEFKDEVLARLLALNAERHREEIATGLVAEDGTLTRDDDDFDEDDFDEAMGDA